MKRSMTAAQPEAARRTKVEIRRLRVRQDMARHAVRLIRERGFEATTVEAIASAADYHASSFFRYFARKEDCVFVGVDEATEQLRAACDAVGPGADAWDTVAAAVVSTVSHFIEDESDLFARQFDLWMREPQLQAPLATHLLEWELIIARALATGAGLEAPDFRSEMAAGAIVSVLRSCARAPDAEPPFVDRVREGIAVVRRGFD
jgi:AcrR family transcriptional regulator